LDRAIHQDFCDYSGRKRVSDYSGRNRILIVPVGTGSLLQHVVLSKRTQNRIHTPWLDLQEWRKHSSRVGSIPEEAVLLLFQTTKKEVAENPIHLNRFRILDERLGFRSVRSVVTPGSQNLSREGVSVGAGETVGVGVGVAASSSLDVKVL
jgi:hypothetical protein